MSKFGIWASAVMAGLSGPGAAQTDASRPITMRVSEQGGTVLIEVWGHAAAPVDARYSLETESAGSRSTQRGVAMLEPDHAAMLARSRMSVSSTWSAKLTVSPSGGEPYTLTRSGGREGTEKESI